ncbi:Flp pilus assembly protein CpaB [Bacillus sp. FJAT-27986]|uniref:Flp pilus assembly protein CpaB n=1 Tax=Bacillus sp. FJAT-27986 TaxID=1743146 RepID=UPI00080AF500|nr:hypothetical protein [Bacillus sp. FJAT-27986]OCA80730.1 hypothetical protein A8L44_16310 [Bacillus sp. FJAT-27986]
MLESKRKAIIFMLLSLFLAILAGFFVLQKVKALNNDLGTVVSVYAANEDISSRQELKPTMITTKDIPKKYLEEYHITNVSDLENKVLVVPLSKGDVISKNILKQASVVLEENNRLISMMSDERVLFDEALEALDRVDIIVSDKLEGNKAQTKIFMKDVKVARIAKKDNKFQGVQLEIPLDKAPELIHMQNYADSVRIIKSNVGQATETPEAAKKNEPVVTEEAVVEQKPVEKKEPEVKKTEEDEKNKEADPGKDTSKDKEKE